MKQLEKRDIINQESSYVKHKIGFLSDKSGYGKTLSMLGLITLNEKNCANKYTIQKVKDGNRFFTCYNLVKCMNVETTLVIVRPELISHWENELKKTDLSCFIVTKQTDIEIENYDVVLCSSKMFTFFSLWNNIQWKRVVIDDPTTVKLKKADIPFSNFYWFITHNPYEMLTKGNVFLEGVNDYDLLKSVIVKNDDEYIDQSFSMPETNHAVHYYYHNIAKAMDGLVSKCVMELIQAGNYDTAMKYINSNKQDKDDILSLLKEKNSSMYDTVAKRLCDSTCPICTECISSSPILFTCCYNVYCDRCISDWIHIQKSCPMCRQTTDVNNVVSIVDTKNVRETSLQVSNIPKNIKTREELFTKLIRSCKKTVVFCNYDESFRIIKKILEHEKIQYRTLNGKKDAREKIINEYVNGDVPVILLNSVYSGNGIDLRNTTDIILYHEMNEYTKTQAIGRANKIGRTSNLNVHYLKMY